MKRSFFPLLALSLACDSQSRWLGVYEPISRACEGQNLVIEKSEISYGDDCKSVKVSTILANDKEFRFKVGDNTNCPLSKHTISIKPEPSDITSAGFGVQMYEERDKSFSYGSYCYFEKK